MKQRPTLYSLVKIGAGPHMRALYERGSLYLNTLDHFRRGEDGNVRYDADDGLLRVYQGPDVSVEVTALGRTILSDKGSQKIKAIRIWMPTSKHLNVYCMTAITRLGPFPFDLRFVSFGDACVVIKRPEAFIARFEAAARELARDLRAELVEYVAAEKHVGEMGAFRKFDTFAWQHEFRLAVDRLVTTGDPFTLELGSLGDIAELLPAAALPHVLFHQGQTH